MGDFVHQDRIAEKLEIARTIGILTDYFVGPSGQTHPGASIRVARNPNISPEAVKDYLVDLLQGLVSDHQIIVTAPFGPPMAKSERSNAAPETVAVAA